MTPLQQIPPRIRAALYWGGYLIGALGSGVSGVWGAIAAASPDVTMPLWLVGVTAALLFLTTQLNLLAGTNVDVGTADDKPAAA